MNRLICFFALSFAVSQPGFAQVIDEPFDLSSRSTTISLDFSNRDYELILYSLNTAEQNATFDIAVTGAFSKPIVRSTAESVRPSTRDRLEFQLRRKDCEIARRLQQTGGYRPVATKAVAQQIGDTRTYVFNAFDIDTTITARLVATSAHAHAYLDVGDTTWLTTAQIQFHLDHFSTAAYPLATSVFGKESDVDNDGKVHFLYTSLVDQAGRGSADVYPPDPYHQGGGIAGFYTIESVLPTNLGGNGNMADLMYLSPSIPDRRFYESLLAHEFQHLISCNQHVLLRNGGCEESWLNEAMSHVCEDLIERHAQGGNRDLVREYLREPHLYSIIGPALFSTGVRGAAYLFARSLMEDHGGTAVLTRLLQTHRVGIDNVERATGQSFTSLIDRHFHRLSGLGDNYTAPFLQVSPMKFSVPSRVTIQPVSVAYLRLMGNRPQGSLTITADPAGAFRARLIPISRGGSSAPSADFDGDGRVGFSDFVAFAGQYGARRGDGRYQAQYDLDGDGVVGFSDFVAFASAYGKPASG